MDRIVTIHGVSKCDVDVLFANAVGNTVFALFLGSDCEGYRAFKAANTHFNRIGDTSFRSLSEGKLIVSSGCAVRIDGPVDCGFTLTEEPVESAAPSESEQRTRNHRIIDSILSAPPSRVLSRGQKQGATYERWTRALAGLLEQCNARAEPVAITQAALLACEEEALR